jgi:hypothetical protein
MHRVSNYVMKRTGTSAAASNSFLFDSRRRYRRPCTHAVPFATKVLCPGGPSGKHFNFVTWNFGLTEVNLTPRLAIYHAAAGVFRIARQESASMCCNFEMFMC